MKCVIRSLLMGLTLIAPLWITSCKRNQPAHTGDIIYTCPMHPSVRLRDPKAKCPICGMDLVPAGKVEKPVGTNAASEFTVPVVRQQQIGVTYATVEKVFLTNHVRALGTVAYDKQRHWDYVSRVEGYVQKLHVASRGERVEQNQPLLTLYSPELLTTQREFLDVLGMRERGRESGSKEALENAERLLESARIRLRLWNIGDTQMAELERTRKPQEMLTLYSPFNGVIQDLGVDQGRRVMPGDHLVDVADLSVVWIWAEFYQDDLSFLKKDMPLIIRSATETFSGTVQVIDPFIQEAKRTVRVRVDVSNPEFKLRPDMYVNVEVQIQLGEALAIPESAVMPTGKRNIVFVDKGEGRLEPRAVELGNRAEGFYAVVSGLAAGERVVNSANFLIDAEAKIQGALKAW